MQQMLLEILQIREQIFQKKSIWLSKAGKEQFHTWSWLRPYRYGLGLVLGRGLVLSVTETTKARNFRLWKYQVLVALVLVSATKPWPQLASVVVLWPELLACNVITSFL